ncbi:MAG: hypothetical protein V7K67_23055 [Nostoc sp.]|uniref:hypothetical protein n=1 Tax=Nostoc sp. TaxID=1180 RepID=UPI002FF4B9AB
MGTGDWGLGTGDWGLGTGDWERNSFKIGWDMNPDTYLRQSPMPNAQCPMPHSLFPFNHIGSKQSESIF